MGTASIVTVVVGGLLVLGTLTTFVGLYISELKRGLKLRLSLHERERDLLTAKETCEALKSQQGRNEAQLEVLRDALRDAEEAIPLTDRNGIIRDRIDELLSGDEDGEGPGEGGGAVSPPAET
jgi:hypothetical protein